MKLNFPFKILQEVSTVQWTLNNNKKNLMINCTTHHHFHDMYMLLPGHVRHCLNLMIINLEQCWNHREFYGGWFPPNGHEICLIFALKRAILSRYNALFFNTIYWYSKMKRVDKLVKMYFIFDLVNWKQT